VELFKPITIGSMKLKNRIALAPMVTHFATENGEVTPKLKQYYAERARGGAGLIIVESGYVHPLAKGGIRRLGLHQDSLIPGLKELTDIVHKEGAKISSQLHHPGRQMNVALHGIYPVSCSSIPTAVCIPAFKEGAVPRTLKIHEIEELVESFGQAAKRSLEAGFDAILIHAAHGYLIQQFLSPCSNTRKDSYGGSFGHRMRFLKEIVLRCREVLGKDYPIMVRISADEFIGGGLTIKDGKRIAKSLDRWGVNAIHVSAAMPETFEMETQPMAIPRGCLVHLAEEIKKVVKIPVAAVGRIVDHQMAEEILRNGKADIITMGRALLADPLFPLKVQERRFEDIRPCIGCLQGCIDRIYQENPISCLVNPSVGFEVEYRLKPTESRKRVLIVGGGPGGMEAAVVAASRGHDVTLYEKRSRFGGQFYLASLPPFKGEIKAFLDFLIRQITKLGVKVHLNEEVTSENLSKIHADVVILASGGYPYLPEIPGIKQENVLTAWEVLENHEKVGRNVVVIGGGSVGAETAEFLADLGKEITLIEMLDEVAVDVGKISRKLLLRRLGEKGVKIHVMTQAKSIQKEGVETDFKGKVELLPADTVVLATGVEENKELISHLRKLAIKFYTIGDCVSPRKAIDAIHEGFKTALQI
jgi:2,4-dienoyl-CoA reductase-like NADH-dependent reductase (Old Yellow Enzyme family)/thioredoxin reductase